MSRSLDDEVRATAEAVLDPELGLSLSELGMVRDVRTGRRTVEVHVALATPGGPTTDRLRADLETAVGAAAGHRRVEIVFGAMSAAQRDEVAAAVAAARRPRGPGIAREVYAVASGKGGVGKSSVAANLAAAWAADGRSVGLIDADVWGYSVPGLFGVNRSPTALNGAMLPVPAHGVALMSLGFFVPDNEPVVWRGPMLHKALTQFVQDTLWGELDVLLLDLPPGTGDVTLSVLELLPEANIVVVTTPQPAARSVAERVGAMARDVSMPIAGVVENMSGLVCAACGEKSSVFGSGGGEQLARDLGCGLLGRIPLDPALRVAGDTGTPVVLLDPDAVSARALAEVSRALRPVRRGLVGRDLGLSPVTGTAR